MAGGGVRKRQPSEVHPAAIADRDGSCSIGRTPDLPHRLGVIRATWEVRQVLHG